MALVYDYVNGSRGHGVWTRKSEKRHGNKALMSANRQVPIVPGLAPKEAKKVPSKELTQV